MPDGTCVVRRVIESDNSCLFNAVGYTMEGLRYKAPVLRQVIVEGVLADPLTWDEAVLGKAPVDYCAWIDDPHHWGGAIELSILSKWVELAHVLFDVGGSCSWSDTAWADWHIAVENTPTSYPPTPTPTHPLPTTQPSQAVQATDRGV